MTTENKRPRKTNNCGKLTTGEYGKPRKTNNWENERGKQTTAENKRPRKTNDRGKQTTAELSGSDFKKVGP